MAPLGACVSGHGSVVGWVIMKRLAVAIATLASLVLAEFAFAQKYPERPIALVNPYAAGGPADLLARTIASGISETLGWPVVVENKPGAGTAIGAAYVARAKPDGYMLFIGGSPSHVVAPALIKNAAYDGIKDFTFIATVASVPNVLVVPAALYLLMESLSADSLSSWVNRGATFMRLKFTVGT